MPSSPTGSLVRGFYRLVAYRYSYMSPGAYRTCGTQTPYGARRVARVVYSRPSANTTPARVRCRCPAARTGLLCARPVTATGDAHLQWNRQLSDTTHCHPNHLREGLDFLGGALKHQFVVNLEDHRRVE